MLLPFGIHTSLKTQINLKMFKKFAIKMCLKQWDLGYQDLLDLSQFPTLKNRRLYLKLCTLYTIMHVIFIFPQVFLPQVNRHSYSLPLVHIPHARTNAIKSSFVPSSVSIWNNLPHEALIAPTITSFKSFTAPLFLFF